MNSSQEARAGVAERWIASHAGGGSSVAHSNGGSPRSSSSSPKSPNAAVWGAPHIAASTSITSPRLSYNTTFVPQATYQGFAQLKGMAPPSGPHKPVLLSQYATIPAISTSAEKPCPPLDVGPNSAADSAYIHDDFSPKPSPGCPQNYYPSSGNEKLYEAYNDLHSLAQDFHKPFDAPAILVVGHQTDGKSALVEALMGFQFNHVGGGTKTRRPITLHMKYNARCLEPVCYLMTDDKPPVEEEKSLEELQQGCGLNRIDHCPYFDRSIQWLG